MIDLSCSVKRRVIPVRTAALHLINDFLYYPAITSGVVLFDRLGLLDAGPLWHH